MKTIFIDFGNVIGFFDHRKTCERLTQFTTLTGPEIYNKLYGEPWEMDFEHGKISKEEYYEGVKKDAELTCTFEEFFDAFTCIFSKNHAVCSFIPKLAKRYRLILASNTNEAHYQKYAGQFSYELSFFAHRCPSHWVGHRKPTEEYYWHCQRFASAPPHECLLIDDLKENIVAARKIVKWNTLLYVPKRSFQEQLAEAGIELEG